MFRASNRIDIIDGIHLTAIAYSDASILAQRLNDRVFYQNTCSIPHPYTLADANHFISAVLAYERKNKVQRDWAIREATGSLIGGIGLLYSHGLDSHRSEMGYWLAIPYWNQGIMTAVIKQFYQHIFQVTKMIRLEALVFQNNLASCRVLEKAGFNKEGYLKKAYQKENKFIDAWLYARIKDDEK